MMAYHKREFTNLAGSGAQSRSIYEKVTQLCTCNDGIAKYLIDGDPLISRTAFYNGARLNCINATDKQVRSRHNSGLIIDEGCLLPGSKVITERGAIKVEDIIVGDSVLNQYGDITTVKKVWSKDWDDGVVKIIVNDLEKSVVKLTYDHRVLVFDSFDTVPVWKNAEDILLNNRLALPKKLSKMSNFSFILDTLGCVKDCGDYFAIPILDLESYFYSGKVWDVEVVDGESFLMPNLVAHNCQEDLKAGVVMKTALQNALTQPNHLILVLSTFHHPEGFFQEYWDDSEEFGFTRYKWDLIDTLKKCEKDIECSECYLTDSEKVRDPDGKVVGTKLIGCNGRARNSDGFREFETAVDIKRTNSGSEVYRIEYLCERPQFYGSVYDQDQLNDAEWEEVETIPITEVVNNRSIPSVGIDWGYAGQTSVIYTEKSLLGVGVLSCGFFHENRSTEIIEYLYQLRDAHGTFHIYADAADPFNNRELQEAGFHVVPVAFKKWKDFGIKNIQRFLETGRIQLALKGEGIKELISQLRKYRADARGNIIKRDDHGPDALLSFLTPNTTIMTEDGWKKVCRIAKGDKVLTHKGRFRSVIRTNFTKYTGVEYSVWVSDGLNKAQPMRVTAEHPFLTSKGWVVASDLKVGDGMFLLGHKCDCCEEVVPYHKKYCVSCGKTQRNSRWLNPTEREESERKFKSESLKLEYASGKRCSKTNSIKATERIKETYANGEILGFKDKDFQTKCRLLGDTAENRAKQSIFMRDHNPMYQPEACKKASIFMKEHTKLPEVKARLRRNGLLAIESSKSFAPKPDIYTDIELLLEKELHDLGLFPKHNKKLGRYFGDFVFMKEKVVVECDGDYWHARREEENPGYDLRRQIYLEDMGYTVIRFLGSAIKENSSLCADKVSAIFSNHSGNYGFLPITVTKIEAKQLAKPKTAYHFEVEEDHSYVARGVVHHNCAMMNWVFIEMYGAGENLREAHPDQYSEENRLKNDTLEDNGEVIII